MPSGRGNDGAHHHRAARAAARAIQQSPLAFSDAGGTVPPMVTDQDIARFLRDALPQLIAVYRFGSTASAQEHAESDLDIAVLAGDPIDAVARFELQERLAAAVWRDVDLVDLRRASTVLRMQVVGRGVPLAVIEPTEHARFADHVFAAYARLNEERRGILSDIAARGSVHGR